MKRKMNENEVILKKPTVKLVGMDGNAFSILSRVSKALRDAGMMDKVKEFQNEATSGNYDHLLQTCFKYVNIEGFPMEVE